MIILPKDDLEYIATHLSSIESHLKNKRIYISGATGFFGKWLVGSLDYLNQLNNLGIEIAVVTRDRNRAKQVLEGLKTTIYFVEHDLSSDREIPFDGKKIDLLIHAGTDSTWPQTQEQRDYQFRSIVVGTDRILQLASKAGVQRFLYVSSGAAGTEAKSRAVHEKTYAESKRQAELATQNWAHQFGKDSVIIRCFSFIGPYLPMDRHFAIGNFLAQAMAGKDIVVQSSGKSIRSYLYAADLVIWTLKLLTLGKTNSIYDVGSEEKMSIKDVGEIIQNEFPQIELKILNQPSIESTYLPAIGSALAEFSLPTPIDFRTSLKKTIYWLTDQKDNL